MGKKPGLIQDPSGANSSKRFFALVCLAQAVILSYVHPEATILVGTWLGMGTGVLGITAFTKT